MKKTTALLCMLTLVQPAFALKCLKDLEMVPVSADSPIGTEQIFSSRVRVNTKMILESLKQAAASQLSQEVDIVLDPVDALVPEGEENTLDIVSFTPNGSMTRFEAVFASSVEQVTLKGKLFPMMQVPVLARLPGPEEVISAQDIEWKKVPARQVSRITLTKTEDILGCTLRSSGVSLGTPLRRHDVARPLVVRRGENVMIISEGAFISLEIQGTALEDGEIQQRIRVLNPMSKRTLNAIVVAPHQVQIERPIRVAEKNEGSLS